MKKRSFKKLITLSLTLAMLTGVAVSYTHLLERNLANALNRSADGTQLFNHCYRNNDLRLYRESDMVKTIGIGKQDFASVIAVSYTHLLIMMVVPQLVSNITNAVSLLPDQIQDLVKKITELAKNLSLIHI